MNLKRLKSLLDNDDKMVAKFLKIFKTETPKQLAQLSRAIKRKEWQEASNTAHGIKSQSKYLDLKVMAAIAYTIEKNTENEENLDSLQADFRKLERGLWLVIKRF